MRARLGGSLVAATLAWIAATGGAVAAAPVACAGSGWVAPNLATFQSRTVGDVVEETFEFYGQHPLCLSDGSQVTGTVAGRLWEQVGPGGMVGMNFAETFAYGDGTLGYSGDGRFDASGWHSEVRTVGTGTGDLAGITGQGSFSPVDPNTGSFSDLIYYVYP